MQFFLVQHLLNSHLSHTKKIHYQYLRLHFRATEKNETGLFHVLFEKLKYASE